MFIMIHIAHILKHLKRASTNPVISIGLGVYPYAKLCILSVDKTNQIPV